MSRSVTPPSRRNAPRSAAPSQNSQKSGKDRRSPFTDHIRRREREIQRQIDALLAARAKFEPDRAALTEENARLDSRERELANIEAEFAEQEARMRTITTCHRSKTDIEQQTIVLHKAATDLQQQLVAAQLDLDSAKMKVVTLMGSIDGEGQAAVTEEHSRALAGLEQAVQRKTVQVARLKRLLDSLQEDVISRENEVIKVELEAVAHEKAVEAMAQKRAELEQRQAAAESAHAELLAGVAKRDQDRRALLKQLDEIRRKRRAADQEQEELNVLEGPVIAIERQLRQIEARCSLRDAVVSKELNRQRQLRAEQSRLRSAQTAFVDSTAADVTTWMAFYEARENEIEARMDALERTSVQIRERCEHNRGIREQYWTGKLQTTGEFIDKVAPAAAADPSNEQLEQRLQALAAQAQALEKEIADAQAEIRAAAEPREREALATAEKAARDRRDRLSDEFRVLEDADLQLQCEEADLEVQNADLRMQVDVQSEAMRALGLRERAARRLIEEYTNEIADAARRCEALAGE